MKIYTIGFTQKPASEFFDLLRAASVRRILEVWGDVHAIHL